MVWVVFLKALFSCLDLKPDDGFLPYTMPELFNKTGHGLTDIVITLLTPCLNFLIKLDMASQIL